MVCGRKWIFNKTLINLRDGRGVGNGNGFMMMVKFQGSYYGIEYFLGN